MRAFTIYKPGQGKVARLMTFIGFGLVILGTVFWLLGEMDTVFAHLADVHRSYGTVAQEYERLDAEGRDNLVLRVDPATAERIDNRYGEALEPPELEEGEEAENGPAVARERVRLRARPPTVTELVEAGRTEAEAERARRAMQVVYFEITEVDVEAGALHLHRPLAHPLMTEYVVESEVGRNHLILLKGIIGVIAIPLSIYGLFWITNRPRIADFLIATEIEMRKVNWPTRKELIGSTWVVIIGAVMMAIVLRIVDMVFAALFIAIGILEGTSPFAGLFN